MGRPIRSIIGIEILEKRKEGELLWTEIPDSRGGSYIRLVSFDRCGQFLTPILLHR